MNISKGANSGGLANSATPKAHNNQVDTPSDDLRESIAESFRRAELTNVGRWLEDNLEYYHKHPNEVIYAHTLVKAMQAVVADQEVNDET